MAWLFTCADDSCRRALHSKRVWAPLFLRVWLATMTVTRSRALFQTLLYPIWTRQRQKHFWMRLLVSTKLNGWKTRLCFGILAELNDKIKVCSVLCCQKIARLPELKTWSCTLPRQRRWRARFGLSEACRNYTGKSVAWKFTLAAPVRPTNRVKSAYTAAKSEIARGFSFEVTLVYLLSNSPRKYLEELASVDYKSLSSEIQTSSNKMFHIELSSVRDYFWAYASKAISSLNIG